jgi:hypothetical protein
VHLGGLFEGTTVAVDGDIMAIIQADSTGPVSVVGHEEVGAPPDALASGAIGVVLRRLSALPPSSEVKALRPRAEDYLQQVRDWQHSPRTSQAWDALMMRVLGLHVAVAKLERGTTANVTALG